MRERSRFSIAGKLNETLASSWTLLSETTVYASRAGILPSYESQLKAWRRVLSAANADSRELSRVRRELVQLRKNLRADGHDVALGGMNIVFEGFRNDACVAEGFERLVIAVSGDVLLRITGQDNHLELAAFLEERFARLRLSGKREYHFLWFKRRGKDLRVSGSDTEPKEDFSRLEALYAARPLVLLGGLKGLK